MYNSLSSDYDRFVNWSSRLAFELPFIESQLAYLPKSPGQPLRILDAATGTGMHVLELAHRGYIADGADLSQGMIEQARRNAAIGRSVPSYSRTAPESGMTRLPIPRRRLR